MSWDRTASFSELSNAVNELDHPRIAALCDDFIVHLQSAEAEFSAESAEAILQLLRRKRHFRLMQEVGDALLQAGSTHPVIRRQYAQALLDQGILHAAVAVLDRLVADTTGESREEEAEARGLLGRAYKQMYVATGVRARDRRRQLLERAISQYSMVYRGTGQRWQGMNARWHGINAVALLDRARRDRIALPTLQIDDPGTAARALAAEILATIDALGHDADAWDHGTAMEACIALGQPDAALRRLDAYLAGGADAFELASTLRQLTEVWGLDPVTEPGARLIPMLQAALLDRQGGVDIAVAPAELAPATRERLDRHHGFEKVLGTERFETLRWFRTALDRCRGVARIEDPYGWPVGTGFLVDGPRLHPGLPPTVLVTNAHVIAQDDPEALTPERARVTFRALGDNQPRHITRLFWSSPPHRLDATVVELDAYPMESSRIPVARQRPRSEAESLQTYIIGHPSGADEVMLSVRDNKLLDADERCVHYRTPTEGGSSGSPVFNRDWELIALHHSGKTRMPRLHGQPGTYPANEGIWLDTIIAELQSGWSPHRS
jgi:hypothetical protein